MQHQHEYEHDHRRDVVDESATTAGNKLPIELILFSLDHLKARHLIAIKAKAISPIFNELIDSIVRSRLLTIINDPTYEFVFESGQPSEYRSNRVQQILRLIDFNPASPSTTTSDPNPRHAPSSSAVARFKVLRSSLSPSPRQCFRLDEDEHFSTLLLSLTLRGVERRSNNDPTTGVKVWTAPSNNDAFEEDRVLASGRRWTAPELPDAEATDAQGEAPEVELNDVVVTAVGSPSSPSPSHLPAALRTRFSFSLSLAEGLDRVFRSWFSKDDRLGPDQLTNRHTLIPSSASCLLRVGIDCVTKTSGDNNPAPSGAAGASSGGVRFIPWDYVVETNELFEFSVDWVDLHSNRLAVGLEESLKQSSRDDQVVMWLNVRM